MQISHFPSKLPLRKVNKRESLDTFERREKKKKKERKNGRFVAGRSEAASDRGRWITDNEPSKSCFTDMRPRRTCLRSSSWARELQRAGWLFELNGAEGVGGADGAFNSGDVRSIKVASLFSRCSLGPPLLWKRKKKKKRRRREKKSKAKVGGKKESDGGGRKIEKKRTTRPLGGHPCQKKLLVFFRLVG